MGLAFLFGTSSSPTDFLRFPDEATDGCLVDGSPDAADRARVDRVDIPEGLPCSVVGSPSSVPSAEGATEARELAAVVAPLRAISEACSEGASGGGIGALRARVRRVLAVLGGVLSVGDKV